jgi:hypothetical protein
MAHWLRLQGNRKPERPPAATRPENVKARIGTPEAAALGNSVLK